LGGGVVEEVEKFPIVLWLVVALVVVHSSQTVFFMFVALGLVLGLA